LFLITSLSEPAAEAFGPNGPSGARLGAPLSGMSGRPVGRIQSQTVSGTPAGRDAAADLMTWFAAWRGAAVITQWRWSRLGPLERRYYQL